MSLHVHSEFSSLDGWSTCDEIAERMIEIGCPYCGLTDHGVVAGHIEFDKAMRSRDLKPVFGCELYHGINFDGLKSGERDQNHLIALAMDDEGLRNLWRLVNSTADREKFHHVGRVSNEDIVKYKKGVMFTSACPLGHVPKGLLKGDTRMLNWYLDNLGDNFRIEVTTYPGDAEWHDKDSEDGEVITPQLINELLVGAADERGVPVTYGDDGHYAFPKDYEFHDMYLAAQTRQSVYTPSEERTMWHPKNAVCIKDEKMVRKNLAYLGSFVDEIITNTHDIGEKADAHLPAADRPHLPVFIPKECPWLSALDKIGGCEEMDATEFFLMLVDHGIHERYDGSERYDEAIEKAVDESEILIEDGLDHYFLWGWEIVQFCKKEGIAMGPGRGSSAGSIVAYALGITDVDPLVYDLYFERFWNKGRAEGFPDIDSDFARSRRSDIREYLIERLGSKRVASIGTIKRMKPIAVMNKLATACDISVPELNEIKKIVEETHDLEIHGTEQIGWHPEVTPGKVIYVNDDVGDEIQRWIGDNQTRQEFIRMCEHTCGRNENYGIHPSGIVISDIDLDDYAPSYLRGGKAEGIPATQFPMKIIDKLKLVKEDVLGLKTLDTLSEWEKLMEEKDIPIDWSGKDLEEHPEGMWDLLDEGFVAGIFQVETHAGKDVSDKIRPRSVEDLGLIVALNRPGPQRAGIPNRYAARKDGRSEVTYPHPMLEEILKPTFGLFVYQEQIIRFMWALGYSKGDADEVRKILGKKQPERLKDLFAGKGEWEGKGWYDTAIDHGFEEGVAKELWGELEGFASYSFNKAHAICYGVIAFRCLFAKYYAPQEWYVACIRTVEHMNRAKLTPTYIKEASRMGIRVMPPDIRYSQAEAAVYDDDIYFGFSDIKGVSTAGAYLVYCRDELQFCVDSPEKLLEELEAHNTLELKCKKEMQLKETLPAGWKSPKQQLNEKKILMIEECGAWDDLTGGVDLKAKQKNEEEYLNVILTDNTEEIIEGNIEAIQGCDSYDEALRPWADKAEEDDESMDYRLPGIITQVRPTKVRSSGAAMGIVTIEFGRDELTFACFSNKWPKAKALFKPRQVGIFTIRHSPPNKYRQSESWAYEKGHLLK